MVLMALTSNKRTQRDRKHNHSILHLMGVTRRFEEVLPRSDDVGTRYSQRYGLAAATGSCEQFPGIQRHARHDSHSSASPGCARGPEPCQSASGGVDKRHRQRIPHAHDTLTPPRYTRRQWFGTAVEGAKESGYTGLMAGS